MVTDGGKLQEIYYYMHTNMDHSESPENSDFFPIVDGYFKQVVHIIETEVQFSGTTFPVCIWKLRRQEQYITQVDAVGDPSFDIFATGAYAGDATFVTTLPNEMMASLLPLNTQAVKTMYARERINYVVKANDKYSYGMNQRNFFEGTSAGGLFAVYTEIMQVVNPNVFNFMFARPTGLKFVWMTSSVAETSENISAEFPCAGYLTNLSILMSDKGAGDHPTVLVFTTQDFESQDDWIFTLDTWFDRGGNSNGITVMPISTEATSNISYPFYYQHFGEKRINISDYAMLNYYIDAITSTTIQWYLTGDFIPYQGVHWKQIYVNQGFSAVESYNTGFEFAVDLDNCVVTLISNMTAGTGNMIVKILRPESETASLTASSDVHNVDELITEGMSNKQSIKSIIPLSSTRGAQQPMINVGNIKAGTVFTWDIISTPTPDLVGVMFFIITGKVARKYYSRSAKFLSAPDVYNYAEHQSTAMVG